MSTHPTHRSALTRRPSRAFVPPISIGLEPRIAMAAGAIHVIRDVVYRDVPGDRQTLDVLIPVGPAPAGGRPVIVAIHGGGWRKFSKNQYEPIVTPLVGMGFLVVAPNYRLSRAGRPSWPIVQDEVRDAVRWVREHARVIGADPGRVAAMGESAGGHLAALLGTNPDPSGSARVQAVVDFYGPTDLAALDRASPKASGPIRQFLGGTPASQPGRYADASPASHVSADDPPFLIVQGSADDIVSPSQSTEMARRLSLAKVPNRLVVIPGAGHGFPLRVGVRNLARMIASFLADALK